MAGIIALALLGVGIVICTLWSANTAIKWQRVVTEIFSCVGVFALCTIIALGATLPEQDTARTAQTIQGSEGDGGIKLVEDIDNLSAAKDKLEIANIKIQIAEAEAEANNIISESITEEMLLKMLIEKWDGVLPSTITITTKEGSYELP